MLLLSRDSWKAHAFWCVLCVVATVVSVAAYAAVASGAARLPGGSSAIGLVYGVLGSLIILFEFALWPRRWPGVRAWRVLGRTQVWLRAHIWLGLLTVPLIWMHSGFTWGGGLSTTIAVLFIVIIVSGILGLALQQFIPRMLLIDVAGETVYSQLETVAAQYLRDADLLVERLRSEPVEHAIGVTHEEFHAAGLGRRTRVPVALVTAERSLTQEAARAGVLTLAYDKTIRPFLVQGPHPGSALNEPTRAAAFFQDLRTRLDAELMSTVDSLEAWCENRRGFGRQAWLHWLLHSWLSVHLPLSVALVVLMLVHAVVALKYW